MKKNLLVTMLFLLVSVAGCISAYAQTVMPIPSSAATFPGDYSIVKAEESTAEWEFVAAPNSWSNPSLQCQASSTVKGDILYSPAISMKAGTTYFLQVNMKLGVSYKYVCYEIVVAKDKQNPQSFFTGRLTSTYSQTTPSQSYSKFTPEEDGEYYLGIRTVPASDSYKSDDAGKLAIESMQYQAVVDLPAKVDKLSMTVGEKGALEATLTWQWPTKSIYSNDIASCTSARIFRKLDSTPKVTDTDCYVATVDGGAAGAEATFVDKDVPSNGKWYYIVVPSNEYGESNVSSPASTNAWIGEDVKLYNSLDEKATPQGDDVLVTYNGRIDPYNKGYIDESKVTVRIHRRKGTGNSTTINDATDVLLTDDHRDFEKYLDNTIPEPGIYRYAIAMMYDGNPSTVRLTDPVFAGGAFDVPYENTLSTQAKFDEMTLVKSGSYGWSYNSSNQAGYFSCYSANQISYLVSPLMNVKAGKSYRISCEAFVSSYTANNYKVGLTSGADAASQEELGALQEITSASTKTSPMLIQAFYTPDEDGRLCFAIKGVSAGSGNVYVKNFKIEESIVAPDKVGELTYAPAADGALAADFSFVVPSVTNAGAPLESVSSIVISQVSSDDRTEVKTIENPAIGETISCSVEVPEAGYYQYAVVATLGDGKSQEVLTSNLWIGYDTPQAVSGFSISVTKLADETVSVKWTASTKGVHSGYLSPDMYYEVARVPGNEVVGTTTELSFIDLSAPEAEFGTYRYEITPVNGDVRGGSSQSNSTVNIGSVVSLPYEVDLASECDDTKCWEGRMWSWGYYTKGFGCHRKGVLDPDTDYTLLLPPFKANPVNSYHLELKAFGSKAGAEQFHVYILPMEVEDSEPEAIMLFAAGEDGTRLTDTPAVVNATTAATAEQHQFIANVPKAGRYRFALECVSPDNDALVLNSLKMREEINTGIDAIEADAEAVTVAAGMLVLPAGATADLYTMAGVKVAANLTGNVATAGVAKGIYLLQITLADGSVKAERIALK